MSKFFDETRRAQQLGTKVAEPVRLDVEELIESIKHGEVIASSLLDARLKSSPKLNMAESVRGPVASFKSSDQTCIPATEAYRTLRTRLMKLQAANGVHSVVVTSAEPGDGKTVTALNLALSCAQIRESRILLLDGDLRSRGLTSMLGSPVGPGLCEVLSGAAVFQQAILSTEYENLSVVIAGSSSGSEGEHFASHRWREFLAWCKESFDLIIVDSPPILSLADTELISGECDGVLMVVKAFETNREYARKSVKRLDPKKLLGIVFNGSPIGSEKRYDYYQYGSSNGNSLGK